MSNAASYTFSALPAAGRFVSGLELTGDAIASEDRALSPSAFLHEAMQSTRNLLALSTVARLIMDRERRQAQPDAATDKPCEPRGDEHFFSSLRGRQDVDGNARHLQYRIRELEISLKRIAVSDLPASTKHIVRQRIREQIDLLRARSQHSPASDPAQP